MKLLLLGKKGQVGRELVRSLLPLGELTALGSADLDLRDSQLLQQTLEQKKPQIIVNAAAYTAVDKAEGDKEAAWTLNETMVAILAAYAKKNKALLVHYSTDYVFNGEKQGAYKESDATAPLNVYGASKLAGEKAIFNSACPTLIFRTSWVFSVHGHNFIKTILNLARHKERLTIVEDQRGAPTSAEMIADVTAHAILAYRQERLNSGLYHLSSSGVTSWYELACYVLDRLKEHKIGFKLESSKIEPILSASYALPALRPKNSVLDTTALSSMLNILFPKWTSYVDRMIEQLIQMRFFA
jgi:dTDP-4-dehydrorhamnose reductase